MRSRGHAAVPEMGSADAMRAAIWPQRLAEEIRRLVPRCPPARAAAIAAHATTRGSGRIGRKRGEARAQVRSQLAATLDRSRGG